MLVESDSESLLSEDLEGALITDNEEADITIDRSFRKTSPRFLKLAHDQRMLVERHSVLNQI